MICPIKIISLLLFMCRCFSFKEAERINQCMRSLESGHSRLRHGRWCRARERTARREALLEGGSDNNKNLNIRGIVIACAYCMLITSIYNNALE